MEPTNKTKQSLAIHPDCEMVGLNVHFYPPRMHVESLRYQLACFALFFVLASFFLTGPFMIICALLGSDNPQWWGVVSTFTVTGGFTIFMMICSIIEEIYCKLKK